MAIRIEQPGLAGLYGAAAVISKQEAEARKKQEQQARKEEQQAELEYRTALRQQDMAIDLQMSERSKLWEIEKMELRSRLDFEREEKERVRKLDSIDSALQQIDKEVLAGRITEQEAYPIKLKYQMNKMGVDTPVSLLPTGDKEDRYGVRPYYLEPEFERDYPELAEAKKREVISGQRRGTVPYYLDPTFISNYPEAARQAQEARGVFLSDEEFDTLMRTPIEPTPTVPRLPTITSDVEYDALPSGTEFIDPEGNRRRKP